MRNLVLFILLLIIIFSTVTPPVLILMILVGTPIPDLLFRMWIASVVTTTFYYVFRNVEIEIERKEDS